MKRSTGVLAILLPIPNPKKTPILPHPIAEGDRLQTAMLHQLLHATPATLPLNLLQDKKLILNYYNLHTGTHIAVFPDLSGLCTQPQGRIHPVLLTLPHPQRLDVFLGCAREAIDLQLPVLTEKQSFNTLLAFADRPHLLSIDAEGAVLQITEGFYIDKDNIRKASNLRRPRTLCLV